MRIATAVSVAILALSTAALAQVTKPHGMQTSNNATMDNGYGPGNAPMPAPMPPHDPSDSAHNMLDNSASPPPTEPK